MKNLRIRTIGKLPETWVKEAENAYAERLRPYGSVEITELPEGHKGSLKPDIDRTKATEALSLLKGLGPNDVAIALDEAGTQYTSPDFAEKLSEWSGRGRPVTFLIGGSWGLDISVRKRADSTLSLGKLTLPHALARIVLLEQLYRAKMIASGKTYHK